MGFLSTAMALAAIAASITSASASAETTSNTLMQRDHLWGFQVYETDDCTGPQTGETIEGSIDSKREGIGGNSLYVKHNVANSKSFPP